MTRLSVNVNKIALIRNSRGRDFPSVVEFAGRFCDLGVHGITVHPRQDERHIRFQDAVDLRRFLKNRSGVEFNIEGYPSERFLQLIETSSPDQCTLVPDAPDQLTSDHGWDLKNQSDLLKTVITRIKKAGVRVSIFLDPDLSQVERVKQTGTDRIELYTEEYASTWGTEQNLAVFKIYKAAADRASELGIGVNAGHDLNLENLARFLEIRPILEVSIGHALVVECLLHGMQPVVEKYLAICQPH